MTLIPKSPLFSNQLKADCAKREIVFRERVYPRLVEQGKMRPDRMRNEIETMREIYQEYQDKADEDAKAERLL